MLGLTNFASEMERERARQRTHDAMVRKARAGYVTGNRVYGYTNVEVLAPDGRRAHVRRAIHADEAAVVRRIYELCAAGLGLTRIAKTLNTEHVPPPRNQRTGWAPTAVREILHRPLYRGEIVWGKSQKTVRGGAKALRRRPESEWLRLDAPDLRIVPADLARAADERMASTRNVFARVPNGRLVGHPSRLDLAFPYLLAGLAYCTACNGALIAQTRDFKKERRHVYGCSYHQKRGMTVCANGVQIAHSIMDREVLASLSKAFDARMIEEAVERALARLRERRAQSLTAGRRWSASWRRSRSRSATWATPLSAGAPPTSFWRCWRPRATGRRPSPGSWRGWTTWRACRR
jgi:site-specific DNA recombinase